MSYTKGPWKTDPECGHETVVDESGRLIADCAIFGLDRGEIGNREIARLIAAAPDLLEAAYSALNMIEQDECAHGRTYGAGNLLRAAIAKATGAES